MDRFWLKQYPPGTPADTINAQQPVQKATVNRSQPGETNPGSGGADLALIQENVDRDAAGQGDVRDG